MRTVQDVELMDSREVEVPQRVRDHLRAQEENLAAKQEQFRILRRYAKDDIASFLFLLTYIYIYIYIYIYTHTQTHLYVHTHTHTPCHLC
jgi:hypothetical protein